MGKRNKYGMHDGCTMKVGGSALMEGVMMRSESAVAMAVRISDGSIQVIKKPLKNKARSAISKIPFLRGAFTLVSSMVDSVYYLSKSAEFVDLEEGVDPNKEPSKFEKFLERVFGDKLMDVMMGLSVVISLAFSIGLFMLLPKVVVELFGLDDRLVLVGNLIEGAIRIGLLAIFC